MLAHTVSSPLGSREALLNIRQRFPGVFIKNSYTTKRKETKEKEKKFLLFQLFANKGHPPTGEIKSPGEALSTFFRASRDPQRRETRPLKTENNAQTVPKQFPINFEKVEKSTFLTPKMVKNDPSKRPK